MEVDRRADPGRQARHYRPSARAVCEQVGGHGRSITRVAAGRDCDWYTARPRSAFDRYQTDTQTRRRATSGPPVRVAAAAKPSGRESTGFRTPSGQSQGAEEHDVDPDRISFTRSLRAARRSTRQDLGTTTTNLAAALTDTLTEILHELLPLRRLRSAARVVKRNRALHLTGPGRREHNM